MPNPPENVPNKKESQPHTPAYYSESPTTPARVKVPKVFFLLAGLIILGGTLLLIFRDAMTESSLWDAMLTCDAQIKDPKDRSRPDNDPNNPKLGDLTYERVADGDQQWIKPNGTHDGYAQVRITAQREGVAQLFGFCDTNPKLALRLFERALNPMSKDSNASARLIALHSANYLARSQPRPYPQPEKGCLEAKHIDSIARLLDAKNEPSLDVRKGATHALSDLIVLTNPAEYAAIASDANSQIPHTKISQAMLDAATAALPKDVSTEPQPLPKKVPDKSKELLIAVRKSTFNGKPVLLLRWSTPTLAQLWWEEHAKEGKWDPELQRYVFP